MTTKDLVKENSVVQLNENAQEGWIGCFLQVSEVKSWGILGWVQIPKGGSASLRPTWSQIDYIGEAVMALSNAEPSVIIASQTEQGIVMIEGVEIEKDNT